MTAANRTDTLLNSVRPVDVGGEKLTRGLGLPRG